MKAKRKSPEIILRDCGPAAVILPIEEHREMVERLEEMEDLRTLKRMRKKPLRFRRMVEFAL